MTAADLARLLSRRDSALCELRRRQLALLNERRWLERRLAGNQQPPEKRRSHDTPLSAGDFARTTPFSLDWGADRGRCIDRYYIEAFLAQHAADIRGAVLEVHDDDYTKQFGTAVTRSDVLDIDASNPRATIVADLRTPSSIPSATYDCILLTQTLHLIYEVRQAVHACQRILRPGGVLLATLPVSSRIAPEYGPDADYWRFTPASAARLFGEFFPPEDLSVSAYGNVLTNVAFLYGLACHELTEAEFEDTDPYFPLVVAVRAVKPHA